MSLHRFLTRLILLCVLPLVLLAAYLAVTYVQRIQNEIDRDATDFAQAFVAEIDHSLNTRMGALHMLAMSPLADQASQWKNLYQEAQGFRQSFGGDVIFYDAQRRALFNTRLPFGTSQPLLPSHPGRSSTTTALKTGVPAVGDVFIGPLAKAPLVGVAVPGLRDGKTAFVFNNVFETSQFQTRLDQSSLPSGWLLSLLDGNGAVIARRGPPADPTATAGTFARRFVVQSPSSPWSVVLEIPRAIYLAPLLDAATTLTIAILGATLAGVLGGGLASRRLKKAIALLASTPAPGAPVSSITEIAALRRLLDETSAARANAERARYDSERRFRAIFELAAVGISLVAPGGRFLLVNQKLCAITGYPQDELLTQAFQDITHPDDLATELTYYRQMLAGEIETYSLEKRYLHKSGNTVWINLTVALARSPDGSPDYFISMVEDIQRRKQAEQDLIKAGALQSAIFNSANFSSIATDAKGVIQIFNVGAERMLGYAAVDVMNKITPADISDPQEVIARAAALSLELNTPITPGFEALVFKASRGIEDIYELTYIRKDGSRLPAVVSVTALRDAQNTIIGYLLIGTDNSERIKSSEKLRVSDFALKAISQGVLISSPDGCILSANDAFVSITGFSEAEILGKTANFMQGPLTEPWMLAAMRLAHKNGTEFSGDILNYRKNGTPFWNELSISPVLNEHDRLTHYIGITRDITERKLAANELDQHRHHLEQLVESRTTELAQARDAAVLATHAKSNFLANMSHELRTPLNAVVGLTGLLADSPLDRRQRSYADKIQLSAQALRKVMDDILDFSKIEAGALKLEQAPFSLKAVLRTTAAIMGVSLRYKPVEALFDVAPDIPDALMGDALRLQQILLNLTSNAVKFTSKGDIVVSVRCLAQDTAQVTLQFAVRDTGIGIAEEQLGPIFDGFVQAETSTTRTHGGTGLGLTISARLAGLMGGQIGVNSTLGAGSEFHFSVTLACGVSAPTVASPDIPSALSILIIDDHPQARAILTQTCIGFGWQATAVDSGAAGLEELRRSAARGCDYDLLLLDWRMPDMDGIEMLRQAHTTPGIGLPLVVLMAPIFELEQAVAVAANDELYLDGIVAKPMTPANLFDAVTRAYAGEFSVTLPLVGHADRRLFGMRLLVAEDNELNQEVIEQVLVRAGAEVVIAGNGHAAVEALRRPGARFDAVLMDIQMPVMDGYTATRIIREELGLVNLPIIAVTAFAQPEDREKSRRAGMVAHIVKPLDVEDLLDLVTRGRMGSAHIAADGPGSALTNRAPAISLVGLDIAAALNAFGGDEKRYKELLRKFLVRHGGEADEARRLFNAQDPDGAIRLLHGLSGVASILQATELARLAAAAEGALSAGNTEKLPFLFDDLQAAMGTLKESVDQLEALWVNA